MSKETDNDQVQEF